jgi:hypothetical protein
MADGILRNLSVSTYEQDSFPPESEENATEELNKIESDVFPSNWQTIGSKRLNDATDRINQNLIGTWKEYFSNPDDNTRLAFADAIRLVSLTFNTKQFTARHLKKNIAGILTTILLKLAVNEQNERFIAEIASIFTQAVTVSPALYDLVEGDTKLFTKVTTKMFECISRGFTKAAFACLQVLNRMSMQGPTLLMRIPKHSQYNSIAFLTFLLQRMAEFKLDDLDALDVFLHFMDTFVTDPGTETFVDVFIKSDLTSHFVSLIPMYKENSDADPLKVCALLDIIGGIIELAKSCRFITQDQMITLVNSTITSLDPDVRESGVSFVDAIAEFEQDEKLLEEIVVKTNAIESVLVHVTDDLNDVNISSQFLTRVSELIDPSLEENIHAFFSTAFTALIEGKDISSNLTAEEGQVARSIINFLNVSFAKLGDNFVKKVAETLFNDILVVMCIDKSSQVRRLLVLAWNDMLKTVRLYLF